MCVNENTNDQTSCKKCVDVEYDNGINVNY